MHWADTIAKSIIGSKKYKPYRVDDMKTPSGFSHIGSLRGPVIHSLVYRALLDAGQKPTFSFVINDFDPIDSLSEEFKKDFDKYMGFSLKTAPSPVGGFDSLGDYFADDFKKVFRTLGVEAKFISSWELYHQGKFDEVIRMALDNADKIQDIYQKVSGSKKKEQGWLPFQVICEHCGRLGTTRVYDWDGQEVSYKCEENMVSWAKGCGHEGKISPFGGTGKLPWKVDWAAHWKVIGITIEGAGKDHASAGGSYDIAMKLCDEVFDYPRPFKIPYEFFLFGGRKMSSSKGLGFKSHDLIEILPADIARFLIARTPYKKQINIDVENSMAIPDLFDDYDKCFKAYNTGKNKQLARIFELSQVTKLPIKQELFIARFRDVATYLQLPNVDLLEKFQEIKGNKLNQEEKKHLITREKYAKIWLEKFAPEDFKFEMAQKLPEAVNKITAQQKKYLEEVLELVEKAKDADSLQIDLYETARKHNIPAKDAFAAIYIAIIGKEHGPKAAWYLLSLPKNKVVERLKEASK